MDREIKQAIKKIVGQSPMWNIVAKVISVQGEECTCDVDGMELQGVRLKAVTDGNDQSLLVTPKVGSIVLLVDMSAGELRDLNIIAYTEVETIQINGGNNGGLVNINDLVNKLNTLVDAFNNHTHQVTTSGSATTQTGVSMAPLVPAQKFIKADFEDTKITH